MVEFAALVLGGVLSMIGFFRLRKQMAKNRKAAEDRHDELRKQLSANSPPVQISLAPGATYNHYESVDNLHYRIDGSAEVIQPKPKTGRVIPLKVEFPEAIGISDISEARLIGPDGKVKDVR